MRAHVFSRFHAPTSDQNGAWPGVYQTYYLCRILQQLGYEVIHYGFGTEKPDCCEEHISVISSEESCEWIGRGAAAPFNESHQFWRISCGRALTAARPLCRKNDILLFGGGLGQRQIAEGLLDIGIPIEYSVTSHSAWAPYKIFPSSSYQWWWYGKQQIVEEDTYGDTAIPDSFDQEKYEGVRQREEKLLFLGQVTEAEGVDLAVAFSKKWGWPLRVGGPGAQRARYGEIMPFAAEKLPLLSSPGLKYLGPLSRSRRVEEILISAYTVLPFRRVSANYFFAIESLLCGVPVLSSSIPPFLDIPQKICYRATLGDFPTWLRNAEWDPKEIKEEASRRYSWQNHVKLYQDFFIRVNQLHLAGYSYKNLRQT